MGVVSTRNGDFGRRSGVDKSRGFKHLSYNELMERRSRGLHFRCGEHYSPTHQCIDWSLRYLVLADDVLDENIGEEQEVAVMELELENDKGGLECRVIGLMSLPSNDSTMSRTMCFEAKINGTPSLVLIDSGATYNFISPQVVSSLDLKVNQS